MPLNAVLAYLGLLALVVGGLGVAYEVGVAPRQQAHEAQADITASVPPPMPATSASGQAKMSWPLEPRHAAVPFNEHMLELLTPRKASEPPVQTAAAPAEADVTVGTGGNAAPPREKRKARTPPPAEQDVTIGVATRAEPEGARERVIEKKERKAKTTPKSKQADDDDDTVEVEVRDQNGRSIRSERVPRERVERDRAPRAKANAPSSRAASRNDAINGEQRRVMEFPLFRLFGLGGGDRW